MVWAAGDLLVLSPCTAEFSVEGVWDAKYMTGQQCPESQGKGLLGL